MSDCERRRLIWRGLLSALALSLASAGCEVELAPVDGASSARDASAMDARALPTDARVEPRDAVVPEDVGPDTGPTPATPIVVAVISDLNGSYGSTTYEASVSAAVDRVVALAPDLVLSTGDMVAGQQAGLDYRAMWRGFHATVSDRLEAAGIPFAVTPGNHDASGYSSFAGERAVFVDEWSSRRPDVTFLDDTAYPLRYSFTMGPALFVSLDDTTIGPLATEQRAWLEAQLVAGADLPVKIVYGHIPLHAFAQGRETEILDDAATEALLVAHDVTAFISGHHHAFYPGRRGALRVVSMACVGSGPRRLIGESTTSPRSILLFEVDESGVRMLDGLGGAGFDVPIARTSLPESVGVGANVVMRDDL